jgi:MFS family permease
VWALGAVSLLTDISSESVAAILPVYLTVVVGLSPLAYGFIDGLYQGVSALVRILGGYLADRADRPKWVAAVGYGLSAATKVLLILFSGLGSLTLAITLDRLGKGLRTGPRDALIAASTEPPHLGRAFGAHRALDTVGAAIGPLLAFAILWAVPGDFASVFVASFAAALLGLAVLAMFVPDLRPRAAARAATTHAGLSDDVPAVRPSLSLMRRHGMGRLVLTAALLSILAISDGFIYLALLTRDDLAATYFPLLFVGTNIAYFLLAIPCGRLADRIGRQRVLVGGHLLLVAAYLCVAGPVRGAAITILCLVCLGGYYATTDGVLAALTASTVPVQIRAVGIATTQTVVAVARFASSLAFGALWTAVGRTEAVLVFAALLLVAIPIAGRLLSNLTATSAPGSGTMQNDRS